MLVPVLLFILGLILLIKGGDWFVDGAVGIAHRFHLPELLIGATVVSIGTTLPEIMVSAQAALQGNGGISYGNAIGSVICNTSLIAALTVAIRPSGVDRKPLRLPAAAFFLAAGFYSAIAYAGGNFRRWHGVVLLAGFVAYLIISVWQMKKNPAATAETEDEGDQKEKPLWLELAMLIGGAAAIAFGANLLVDNGTKIAEALGVPSSVIGLTMIALGTSLPELVTAVTSLVKGHSALSLGNIIGANLFNLVAVSGLAITIRPFNIHLDPSVDAVGSLRVDIPVMLLVMLLLCVPALKDGRLRRWQGILLLCIYVAFTAYQFVK